jgi:hypothetical protein
MRLKRLLYRYDAVTAGEKLYLHLRTEFIDTQAWREPQETLLATGRALEFIDLFQQIAAVNLTGRFVVAGASFAQRNPVSDPLFEQDYLEFIRDTLGESGERADRVYRLAEQAVIASRRLPSAGLLNRIEKWAQRHHQHCYICRAPLDFTRQHERFAYTCEHVWPRMYGGDSTEDNLLPCCMDCNSRIKRDCASWSQVSVQSLILGIGPKPNNLKEIDNIFKFAMHTRAAQLYAALHGKTLKTAFIDIGPWTDVRVMSQHDAGDFFNLANHDQEVNVI